jgi:peptide/nickel transport system permease protein
LKKETLIVRQLLNRVISVPLVLAAAALIGLMPLLIQPSAGGVRLNVSSAWDALAGYVSGLFTGESFLFYLGKNQFQFFEHIGNYLFISLAYVTAASLVGLTIGLLSGILFAWTKSEWWKRLLELTGVLPDFVIILLLQFAIVYIAQQTGVVLFKVANVNDSEPAVILPLLSMIIIPALYITRNAALHMRLTLTEDYIANAKARGLGKAYIYFFHALPNVIPFVKADLHKLIGIIMSNLFIVEYLYNVKGVTSLLFSSAFNVMIDYQFPLVVNCLFTLLALYVIIYFIARLFLAGWERAFIR